MPALSVILVVGGEQAFIEECLRSVVGDVEIVVVDDASGGHVPAVLERLADADPRVRVITLPERTGRAGARARGLAEATGDRVWFVEATDKLAPGAIAQVRAVDADVVAVGFVHEDALGRRKRGAKVTPDGAAPDLWRLVLRRALIADATFGDGLHGELTVTWPALLAGTTGVVPGPVYVRRRPGNAEKVGGPRDALGHYATVLPLAPERIAPAATKHLLALSGRLSGEKRAAFVHDAAALLAEGSAPRAEGAARAVAGPRERLLLAGDAKGLERHDRRARRRAALSARRGRLAKRWRRVRTALRNRRDLRYYARRRKQPLDPDLAVFAAYWQRQYACNPKAIYEAARDTIPGLRGVWVVHRDAVDALPTGVEHVVAGTREYYDVLARASYFVNNVNFANHLVKRPGTKHVMTHHGTPLKRMGTDLRDTQVAGQKMDFDALLERARRWDFSVSSNPLSTLTWERVFPVRTETLEAGYPRNDALAASTDADTRRHRSELGIPAHKTAVLYAPTHREYRQGYQPVLDVGALAEGLGEEFVVLARIHYFYGADPHTAELHRQGRILDVSGHPCIEALCLASDALVTDYSSLMFDYAVLDRPIVIHAPDWEVYVAMRGTTFDLMDKRPGAVTRTEAELVDCLRSGAHDGEDARRDRAAFRAEFCPWDDGHAAERVVRRVWLDEAVTAPVTAAVAR